MFRGWRVNNVCALWCSGSLSLPLLYVCWDCLQQSCAVAFWYKAGCENGWMSCSNVGAGSCCLHCSAFANKTLSEVTQVETLWCLKVSFMLNRRLHIWPCPSSLSEVSVRVLAFHHWQASKCSIKWTWTRSQISLDLNLAGNTWDIFK